MKYVRYQLEALGAPAKLTKQWVALGDDLGWEHDHTVLIGVCGEHPSDDGFRSVAKHSKARREILRSTALEVGVQLFVLKPREFVESVALAVGLDER